MLKPIETEYRGYRFRSRLEARWAVYFDALGCKWEYEPEGFDLGGGVWYLPDFRVSLPGGLVNWYEVKPSGVTHDEKFTAFCNALFAKRHLDEGREDHTEYAFLLSGDPIDNSVDHLCPRCLGAANLLSFRGREEAAIYCERCDFTTPDGGGNEPVPTLAGLADPYKGTMFYNPERWSEWVIKWAGAEEKARQARFEHRGGHR